MKKFPGGIIIKGIFQKHYLADRLEKQGKYDKKEKLLPEPVDLAPVLGQRPAVEQEAFRNKKPIPAGF
jgi:hypothetical protein